MSTPGNLRHSKTHRAKVRDRGPRFHDYAAFIDYAGMRQLMRSRKPDEERMGAAELVMRRLWDLLPSGGRLMEGRSLDYGRAFEVKVRMPVRSYMRVEEWFRLRPLGEK